MEVGANEAPANLSLFFLGVIPQVEKHYARLGDSGKLDMEIVKITDPEN